MKFLFVLFEASELDSKGISNESLHVNGEFKHHGSHCFGDVFSDHVDNSLNNCVLGELSFVDLLLNPLHLLHLVLLLQNPVLVALDVAINACLFEVVVAHAL